MAINKIKLRNLDDEIINYFRQNQAVIGYDDLSSEVVTDIKNNIQQGNVNKYDDQELRQRIIELENNSLSKTEAENTYAAQTNYDTSSVVDSKINNAILTLDINGKIDNKFNTITEDFVTRTAGNITEDLLSYDLQMKVNARYENKRPSEGGSGSSDIGAGEFTKLQIQVNENTNNLTNLQEYVNNNVILKTEAIPLSNLESAAQNLINNARQETDPITINDLDESLRESLASSGRDIHEIINSIYSGAQDGQIAIAQYDTENQRYNLKTEYLCITDLMIFRNAGQFEDAKIEAKNSGFQYLGDVENNTIYQYNQDSDTWTLRQNEDLYQKILGTLVVAHPGNVLCFCMANHNIQVLFDLSEYLMVEEVDQAIEENEVFINLKDKVDQLETKLNEVEIAANNPDISNAIYYGDTQPPESSTTYLWVTTSGQLSIKVNSAWQRISNQA